MKKLCFHPLFLLGEIIRLGLIFTVLPIAVNEWYVPFLSASTAYLTLDPWGVWLSQGGAPAAFPYGYAMWLVFLPLTLLCKLLGVPLFYGYGFTLLVADFGLLFVLRKLLPNHERLLLAIYWLSPIVILASYGLGYNDLIPVFMLVLSLYFTRQYKLLHAGLLCGAAISAKLSMVLALPFFLIYLGHNRALRQLLPAFLKGLAAVTVVFGLPFVFSGSGLHMLFSNPEMDKVYQFALNIGNATQIYVVPLAYMVMLYAAWRVRRMNFDLFQSVLGMAFLLVVLLTSASPGWFIWLMPLLVYYQVKSGKVAIVLGSVFSTLYIVSTFLATPFAFGYVDMAAFQRVIHLGGHASSLLHTSMIAVGIVLGMRIWRETVSLNDYFRLSRKPFVIGVAGDSGAGKDTFASALTGLFGNRCVASLSGDDYHLWDRHKPMWQVMTHLNPMANDLEGFANDLLSLTDGKSILSRHYDHQTGKMSRPFRIRSNDFIIASGLHALYLPILRSCYNLSIFLEIDEDLRRYFKVQRDVHQRGHSIERVLSSFERREPDSVRFIRPQAAYADLVFSLRPIHPRILEDANGNHPLRLKLGARSKNGLNEMSLTRILIGVCGLHVDMVMSNEASELELTIEGETSAEDIALAAKLLCPRISEFFDIYPKWEGGVIGLMQLITLSHINQALSKRFI